MILKTTELSLQNKMVLYLTSIINFRPNTKQTDCANQLLKNKRF